MALSLPLERRSRGDLVQSRADGELVVLVPHAFAVLDEVAAGAAVSTHSLALVLELLPCVGVLGLHGAVQLCGDVLGVQRALVVWDDELEPALLAVDLLLAEFELADAQLTLHIHPERADVAVVALDGSKGAALQLGVQEKLDELFLAVLPVLAV